LFSAPLGRTYELEHDPESVKWFMASRAMETVMTQKILLTERAAKRIRAILSKEAHPSMLRVSVEGGGCSGFRYDFKIETEQAGDDLVLEHDGATVLIDPVSVDFLEGCEIDFVDDLIGASFQIRNPNATSSCGCGTSFSM